MNDDSNQMYSNDYLRKLLVERPRIRAKLENPGGSIIMTGVSAMTEQSNEYSPQIGSSAHLDLIEMELHFDALPRDQQDALLQWALGMTAQQAAYYNDVKGSVFRKRRQRGIDKMVESMNGSE
jgi:DNA-directed RNA polymerase specialized sigma24 family protein